MLPGAAPGVKGKVVLHTLLGQNRRAGRHVSHHRHLVGPGVQLLQDRLDRTAHHGDGPGFALGLGNESGPLQPLEVEVDGRGGLESHLFADLPHRRGIPVLGLKRDDKFIDLLLLGGKRLHGRSLLFNSTSPRVAAGRE